MMCYSGVAEVLSHRLRGDGAPGGRQCPPKEAQVRAMQLSDWKEWNEDPPLPRPDLRICSGNDGISLEIPAY